ncbi:MAG TPA: DNA repair protein RecN [Rhizomicrobium sp.]|jgi:DNA repair protein RecN (Recombination protein N)|nr:DNA repair protein RecN [Rhizomicrobium sp.]
MLATLKIRDLVLIEDVSLDFVGGLNVLTGETGAGKSILLDALGLATGSRAGSRSGVRGGAAQGSATAIFDLPSRHEARALIADNGFAVDGEIILRRVLAGDGRTRAFLNDEPIGVALLRDLGSDLVEIHGQSDDRGLFDTATHRRLLDAFGGLAAVTGEVAARYQAREQLRAEADALRRTAEAAARQAEFLRHAVDELSALAPEEGEEARLASERALLLNASRIAEDISSACELLSGDKGAESALATAMKRLARLPPEARARVQGVEAALDQAFALTEDARRDLDAMVSQLEIDANSLERTEERLFGLRASARKYAVQPDALPRLFSDYQTKLDTVSGGDAKLEALSVEAERAHANYMDAALRLSAARRVAAGKLEEAVARELAPLKLGHAQFRVALESLGEDGNANGLERVSFEVATVEGASFGSLVKIASGGELARFSLALKVALAETSPPAALVFDEVDRGVGGAVADAVGERLQRVARSTQVLLVTHSPQVAARAERHFRITRTRDRTKVELLSQEERIEELARMLAGAAVTEEARAAARRLLAEAQTPVKTRKRA